MKKLGIIGGIGPEATTGYYMAIIKDYQNRVGTQQALPEIVINSINMYHMFALLDQKDKDGVVRYLATAINGLQRAGADFVLMCGNTPHIVFDQLEKQVDIPLLSIVQTALAGAKKLGLTRLGLLGTKFTMQHDFFSRPFEQAGIKVVTPDDQEQIFIHRKIVDELENGIINPETKQQLLAIIMNLIHREHLDGIVLGCTELPLIIKPADLSVSLLDIAKLHISAAVDEILK